MDTTLIPTFTDYTTITEARSPSVPLRAHQQHQPKLLFSPCGTVPQRAAWGRGYTLGPLIWTF